MAAHFLFPIYLWKGKEHLCWESGSGSKACSRLKTKSSSNYAHPGRSGVALRYGERWCWNTTWRGMQTVTWSLHQACAPALRFAGRTVLGFGISRTGQKPIMLMATGEAILFWFLFYISWGLTLSSSLILECKSIKHLSSVPWKLLEKYYDTETKSEKKSPVSENSTWLTATPLRFEVSRSWGRKMRSKEKVLNLLIRKYFPPYLGPQGSFH